MNGRKKWVRRLKNIIIAIEAALLVLLSFFCILLSVRVEALEQQMKQWKEESHRSLEIIWEDMEENKSQMAEPETEILEEGEAESEEAEEWETENIRKVYLTFDDGPSVYTKDILDILKRYNVKATFFVTGMNETKYDEYLQMILEDGHSLGIHSYSHVYSEIYSSLEAFQADYQKMQDYIYRNTGQKTKLFRFPGGSGNGIVTYATRKQIIEWLTEEDIVYFDWNVSSGDSRTPVPSAEEIAQNCIEGIKSCDTAIVLLHDASGKKSTVEALPLIIEGINRLGDTQLLPMDTETVAIQQISVTND